MCSVRRLCAASTTYCWACLRALPCSFLPKNESQDEGNEEIFNLQDGGVEDKKVGEKIENVNLLRIFTTEKSLLRVCVCVCVCVYCVCT
jgi:hypothetical protein